MSPEPVEPDCECGADANVLAGSSPVDGVGDVKDATDLKTIRAMLIDDDRDDYFLTKDIVEDIPGGRYKLEWSSNYDSGLEAICAGEHHVYLIDYQLGKKTGIDLLRESKGRNCSGPMILLTGQGQRRTDLEALDAGADDYLEKAGLTPALLERTIRYALAKHAAEANLEQKVRERTDELARVNEALREADQRKDEFLSTLGHELRNPLAPIRNSLEIMRLAGNNPDVVARQRERMERQVTQMVRLVDDLLDVSRVVTGKLRLAMETLTLNEVIQSAIELSRPHLEKAELQFTVNVPEEQILLDGDRLRLAQVFSNLLNNAAKYTDAGGTVELTSSWDVNRVVVRVRDSGVGVPIELLPRIFDLFTQVDRSLNRSQGGLGVGLALVKRLVEMHGGLVRAHSDGPGTGAEFTVELPTKPRATDQELAGDQSPL